MNDELRNLLLSMEVVLVVISVGTLVNMAMTTRLMKLVKMLVTEKQEKERLERVRTIFGE